MIEQINQFWLQFPWLFQAGRIGFVFAVAFVFSFIAKRLARRILFQKKLTFRNRKVKPERQNTLHGLLSSAIVLFSFLVATLVSAGFFIKPDTLAWVVGLFSAAFGLGARPLISDYLAGLSFIFEDTFAVGEKIEFPSLIPVEGVIETINLRTTSVRAPSGELFVVPNGEIRTVRNFSRGKFSVADITLKILTADLGKTIKILDGLDEEAVVLLPNLIEPWQVISPEGVIGQYTELTLVAKARFGKAAEMRPRLLNLVQERLCEAEIELVN